MIPKMHPKGKSFKGAALYLLHDKDHAASSDRVAWVQVRNFATEDPTAAWKIMIATSYSQDRLKEEAGIKNTGRKSKDHVLHLSLSWHPDEADGLTREEMMKAALGALRTLGASKHQALIICHTDERQPHVHILVNRVSQEDGRMLSSSKEKEKLSRWAQAYEEARGQVFCTERVVNNAARDRGEFTRGAKDIPRHIMELEKSARKHVSPDAANKLSKELRVKDHKVARQAREIETRHHAEWIDLYAEHKSKKEDIETDGSKAIGAEVRAIRDDYRPQWKKLHERHRKQRSAFETNEARLSGRVGNAFRSLDLRKMIGSNSPVKAVKELFDVFASSGARLGALKRIQKSEKHTLAREQGQKETEAKKVGQRHIERKLDFERKEFFSLRSDLMLRQSMDQAFIRSSWRKRDSDRSTSWNRLIKQDVLKSAFNRAAKPEAEKTKSDGLTAKQAFYLALAKEINADEKREQNRSKGQEPDQDFDRER